MLIVVEWNEDGIENLVLTWTKLQFYFILFWGGRL
jgi:hypothetical protein